MNDLRKAATEFATHVKRARRQGPVAPPNGLISDVEKFHQALHTVAELAGQMAAKADKAFDEMEDLYDRGHREWVAKGNHPDDYLDTPEGQLASNTMTFCEDLTKLFSTKDSDGLGHRLKQSDWEVEDYLNVMRAGRW